MNRKHGRVSRLFRAIPTIVLVLTYTQEVSAKDLLVPGNYRTIGEAIRTAEAGVDRVVITDGGTYRESIVVDKDLVLVSDPPGSTLTGELGPGVKISAGGVTVSLEGLRIKECAESGIVVDPGPGNKINLTLSNVSLLSNKKSGISFLSGDDHVFKAGDDCRFEENTEAGILSNRVIDMHISNCSVQNNAAGIVFYGNDETVDPERVARILIEDSAVIGNVPRDLDAIDILDSRFYAPEDMNVHPAGILQTHRMSMSLVVKRSRIRENLHMMASCAAIGYSSNIEMFDSDCDNNNWCGVVLSTQGAKFTAERCSFSEHRYDALSTYRTVDLRLKDCKVSKNGRGFFLKYPVNCMEEPLHPAQLVFENCAIENSQMNGIYTTGRAGVILTAVNTVVRGNGMDGMLLEFTGEEEPGSCVIQLSGTAFESNQGAGLMIQDGKFDVSISENCRFNDNGSAGIFLRDAVSGNITDCDLSSNRADGLVVAAPRSGDYPAWENEPEIRLVRCNVNGNTGAGIAVRGGAKHTFRLEESTFTGNNTAVSTDADEGSIMQFVMTGSMFRDNPGDPLRIGEEGFILMDDVKESEEGAPNVSRWGFVGGHSAVTAVDCTFTDTNGNVIAVPALSAEGTDVVDWDTLEKDGVIPFVPVKGLSSSNAFSVIYSWSEGIKDLVSMAEAYRALGMIEKSNESFKNAQARMLDHPPSGLLQDQVSKRREDTIRNAERTLKNDPAGSSEKLLLLLEQSSPKPEISACLQRRYSAFRDLLRLAPSFVPEPPEVPLSDTLKRDVLAVYLKEVTDLVGKKVGRDIIVDHLNELAGPEIDQRGLRPGSEERGAGNALVSRLYRKDALFALDEFAVEVEPLLEESPELKADYHRSMARAYKALHDPAGEESHLKVLREIGQSQPRSDNGN